MVPLQHPALRNVREGANAGGEYPLLTLPEQRQVRHSGSTGLSLQIERSGSSAGTNRISLPRSVSIDIQRRKSGESPLSEPRTPLDKGKGRAVEEHDTVPPIEVQPAGPQKKSIGYRNRGQSIPGSEAVTGVSFIDNKGKGKVAANMSLDIERGLQVQSPYGNSTIPGDQRNSSNASLHSRGGGIGPALSSNNTSIVGDPDEGPMNAGEEWGPQHPCFPHMNPHVPLSSPLYQTTRIIRIRRDWMLEGDLAPTFSNLYPEILDPAGVSELDFRQIIEKVNEELIPAFDPYGARNIFDAIMGLVTGWVWDDLGLTGVKSRLRRVEGLLEEWNRQMEGKVKEGMAPRIVSLRRTGYMNVSFLLFSPFPHGMETNPLKSSIYKFPTPKSHIQFPPQRLPPPSPHPYLYPHPYQRTSNPIRIQGHLNDRPPLFIVIHYPQSIG